MCRQEAVLPPLCCRAALGQTMLVGRNDSLEGMAAKIRARELRKARERKARELRTALSRDRAAKMDQAAEVLRAAAELKQAKLDERRKYEHGIIHEHDQTSIEEGQVWYIIDKLWLSSWHRFVSNEIRDPLPGPISNHTLLDNEGNALPNLRKGQDYRGVNASTWSTFSTPCSTEHLCRPTGPLGERVRTVLESDGDAMRCEVLPTFLLGTRVQASTIPHDLPIAARMLIHRHLQALCLGSSARAELYSLSKRLHVWPGLAHASRLVCDEPEALQCPEPFQAAELYNLGARLRAARAETAFEDVRAALAIQAERALEKRLRWKNAGKRANASEMTIAKDRRNRLREYVREEHRGRDLEPRGRAHHCHLSVARHCRSLVVGNAPTKKGCAVM